MSKTKKKAKAKVKQKAVTFIDSTNCQVVLIFEETKRGKWKCVVHPELLEDLPFSVFKTVKVEDL